MVCWMGGTETAEFQEMLITRYLEQGPTKLSRKEKRKLNNNVWINLANKTAISNLTVRNLALQLAYGVSKNLLETNVRLYRQVHLLSGHGQLWAEGYSYWMYTVKALGMLTYENSMVDYNKNIIPRINLNWIKSGWLDGDYLMPAPFGDLRDYPLNGDKNDLDLNFDCAFFAKKGNKYHIKPYPIGFNSHVETQEKQLKIIDGGVVGDFKWYDGYENKYIGKIEEVKDYLDRKRLKSLKTTIKY